MLLPDLRRKVFTEAAEISTMPTVEFLVFFTASHPNARGINDDDVVSCVKEWRVPRTMLSLKKSRGDCRETTQDLCVSVDDVPLVRDVFLAWDEG